MIDPRIRLAQPGRDRRHGPGSGILGIAESADVSISWMNMIGVYDLVIKEIVIIPFVTILGNVILGLIPG